MKRTRTHYSNDFKLKAIELSKERGSVDKVAKELNVSRETLRNWKRSFKEGTLPLTSNPTLRIKSKQEEEIIKLRKELYDTKLERDILKKAVGIFSKSDK